MSIVKIQTEFGIPVETQQPTSIYQTASHMYPYTLTLLAFAQQLETPLAKVFDYQGIEDRPTRKMLEDTLPYLRETGLPPLFQQLAAVHMLVAGRFRNQALYLQDFQPAIREERTFYFAAFHPREKQHPSSQSAFALDLTINRNCNKGVFSHHGVTEDWSRIDLIIATNYLFNLIQHEPTLRVLPPRQLIPPADSSAKHLKP